MFEPVSTATYCRLNPNKQILICSLGDPCDTPRLLEKWATRACAIFAFGAGESLSNLVRDLLANPQIRAIVFDGPGAGSQVFRDFWIGTDVPEWGINAEHITLVRQFVDLYDEDCGHRLMQPFWPQRLKYMLPPR